MKHLIFIALALLAIPWAISTWWKVRRARGPREKAFIGRTRTGFAMLTVMAAILFTMLGMRGQLIALPLMAVTGFILHHGYRKAQARIQAEDADPLSRAKRIN